MERSIPFALNRTWPRDSRRVKGSRSPWRRSQSSVGPRVVAASSTPRRRSRRRSLSPKEFGEVVEIGGEGGVGGEVSERPAV